MHFTGVWKPPSFIIQKHAKELPVKSIQSRWQSFLYYDIHKSCQLFGEHCIGKFSVLYENFRLSL